MVIMDDALPGLKRFLKPVCLNQRMSGLVIRCVVAFVMHLGRMAAARASNSVRTQTRHRAQICRFLGRKLLRRMSPASVLREQLLHLESRLNGTFYFLVDSTLTSQQGSKTENTFSTGNRQRRPRKGSRELPPGLWSGSPLYLARDVWFGQGPARQGRLSRGRESICRSAGH